MSIVFTCENCGRRFKVDDRSQGRRGRCSTCRHAMRIPSDGVAEHLDAHASPPASEPGADLPFKLSPPEPHPMAHQVVVPGLSEPAPAHPVEPRDSKFAPAPAAPGMEHGHGPHVQFELLDDDADHGLGVAVSPAIARGLAEIADFEKDRKGYRIEGDRSGVFSLLRLRQDGPAGWVYSKWRAGVGSVLKVFRWVDTWAYLFSIPFLILMILGIAAENRSSIHTGAVVVVLANYGRFWAHLLAFFIRPFKDGPLQGLGFLFPPYMIYYLSTRWDSMKKILRRIATSCIPILGVVLIYAFDPTANPAVKNVQGVGARLEAGKHQLDKEIASEFEDLEKKLSNPQKPKERQSRLER
jgi:hypothetical protein